MTVDILCSVVGCIPVSKETSIADSLVKAKICSSRNEARRLAKQKGLYLSQDGTLSHISEWVEITNVDAPIEEIQEYVLISRGKKWTMNHMAAFVNGGQ